jgi:hypothetical protein
MKILSYSLLISVLFFAACNNAPKEQTNTVTDKSAPAENPSTAESSVTGIISAYLELKNALAKDNDKHAASSGKALENAFTSFNKSALAPDKEKIYTDIAESAKEHAEHIAANVGNIKHQREHFETLSQDIYDLAKAFGPGQKLYVDHCPMYNNNKGASWISESKEISNPYLGQSMPTCGTVKEELN